MKIKKLSFICSVLLIFPSTIIPINSWIATTFQSTVYSISECSDNQKTMLLTLVAIPIGLFIGMITHNIYTFYTIHQKSVQKQIPPVTSSPNQFYSPKSEMEGFLQVNTTFDAQENLHNLIAYFTHKINETWNPITFKEEDAFDRYICPIIRATINQKSVESSVAGNFLNLIQKMRLHNNFTTKLDDSAFEESRRDLAFISTLKDDFNLYRKYDDSEKIYQNGLIASSLDEAYTPFAEKRTLGKKK